MVKGKPGQTADYREDYRLRVYRTHKSALVRKGFDLYVWFWFHTEFWLAPIDRRPYTFIMRDWIYPHMPWFITIILGWYGALTAWVILAMALSVALAALWIGILSGLLVAHLIWGSSWKPGEQEWPQILDY